MEYETELILEPLTNKFTEENQLNGTKHREPSIKTDFSELISHFLEYTPSYISTPFKGTCLKMTQDGKSFIFGSREGRLVICDIKNKQITLDKNLEEGSIWAIDITKDFSSVYSGGQGGKIKKFSLSTLDQQETLEGHKDEVNAVILSKDNKTLFSCSDDTSVIKWDLVKRTNKILYNHNGIVYGLDLSEDNIHVASCSGDGNVIVYNNIENKIVFTSVQEGSCMWCVKISSRNNYLIAGDNLSFIYVWNFGNWNLLRKLTGHKDRVRCLEIASNEKYFVSGGIDNLIKIWDLEYTRDEVTIFGHTNWVKGIIISKDHEYIHTMSDDCRIMTSKVFQFDNHINVYTQYPIIKLLSGKKDKYIYGMSLNKIFIIKSLKIIEEIQEFDKEILDFGITSNGTKVVVFLKQDFSTETEVVLINVYGQKNARKLVLKTSSVVYSAVASDDGKYLITGEAFRLSVWDLESGDLKHIFRSHTADVTALAIESERNSRTGNTSLHLFAGDKNGIIKYYYLYKDFEEIAQYNEENQTEILIIKLSPNRKYLFSGTSTYIVHVWSIESKIILTEIVTSAPITQIYFTQDNLSFFINYNTTIDVWNIENFSKCSSIALHEKNNDLSFSVDEKEIYIGFDEYYKKLENPLKTQEIRIYGDNSNSYRFTDYLTRIISGEVPKHDIAMDNWLIEPYHINTLHLYAYYNLPSHITKSLKHGGAFFPSRSGYTPLSIAIEKKLGECIDAIFEAIKLRSEQSPLAFYYFSDSIPALNRSSYSKVHELYELAFKKNNSATLPIFCEDTVKLPIIKNSSELVVSKDKFMDADKYKSDDVAIEFLQSYVKLDTTLGSNYSLEFIKSLIECKNLEVYSTSLIKILLDEKWKVIKWIFAFETILYLTYLVILCLYSGKKVEERDHNLLIVPFAINIILFFNEIVQITSSKWLYFQDFWNYVDISRFLVFSVFCLLEVIYFNEELKESFLFVSVILSLLRGLSYFRIHSTTRWVINLIFDVFYQLWALIFVSIYTILSLWMVYWYLDNNNFFGETEESNLNTQEFNLEWIMFFFILVLNPVIILNLFISIVGDAFERNQDEKIIKDGQELAQMIFEAELLFFWNRKSGAKDFLHVVREEHAEIQAQNTAGQRIKRISESVNVLSHTANKNKHEILELKNFVQAKIQEIQDKTEFILQQVIKNKEN